MNTEAIERIRGYCCEVTQAQWDELVRVADEVIVSDSVFVWRHLISYKYAALIDGKFQTWNSKCGVCIPFPDFLAKLRGDEKWQPKAREMVEVNAYADCWSLATYIGKFSELFVCKGKFECGSYTDFPSDRIRPLRPTITRTEAEQLINKRIID
jgi:hypothetical protein